MVYLIFFFIFYKENGTVKKWDLFLKSDTVFIFYTLDKNEDKYAENLKLLKLDLNTKRTENKVIYKDKYGIDKIKLLFKNNDYFLFFTLLRPFKEKKVKKNKIMFMFNKNKIKKIYEIKKKNRFFLNTDFIFEKDNLLTVFDIRNKIYILKNSRLYEFGIGVNPIFYKEFILFLKGLPEKPNVLFKANKVSYENKEIVFDKEPVFYFRKEEDFIVFLTDKDENLLPEKVYLIDSTFKYKEIFNSDNHIIVPPSLEKIKDTIYILICASEEFTPDKLIFLKISNNKVFEKEILNKEGIEAKWLKYPNFILLQKTENESIFELTSVK